MRASGLRRLQNGKRGSCTTEVEETPAVEGNMLAVTGAGPEMVAQFVVASTEPRGRIELLEAAHTSDPPFDAPVVLFQAVVLVDTGPVLRAQLMPPEGSGAALLELSRPECGTVVRTQSRRM
ncbi:hypothetical protein FHS87_004296 [Roseomonas pecuniae]|uniref:Uncharacterized protein n=1 Tax=Muricoccus pecuniae TaxID=693023 RepID=A0A840Y7V3_9PROT|nr:hypothetical protein [Roseomonas pecuniae]MBB5696226.1 hypothetical protein [Roseomonas pecuniae]